MLLASRQASSASLSFGGTSFDCRTALMTRRANTGKNYPKPLIAFAGPFLHSVLPFPPWCRAHLYRIILDLIALRRV